MASSLAGVVSLARRSPATPNTTRSGSRGVVQAERATMIAVKNARRMAPSQWSPG
jgi:hypothetical protein